MLKTRRPTEKFKTECIGLCDIYMWQSVFGDGESNGPTSGWTKSKRRPPAISENFEWSDLYNGLTHPLSWITDQCCWSVGENNTLPILSSERTTSTTGLSYSCYIFAAVAVIWIQERSLRSEWLTARKIASDCRRHCRIWQARLDPHLWRSRVVLSRVFSAPAPLPCHYYSLMVEKITL